MPISEAHEALIRKVYSDSWLMPSDSDYVEVRAVSQDLTCQCDLGISDKYPKRVTNQVRLQEIRWRLRQLIECVGRKAFTLIR